jgi:hypothetical protein
MDYTPSPTLTYDPRWTNAPTNTRYPTKYPTQSSTTSPTPVPSFIYDPTWTTNSPMQSPSRDTLEPTPEGIMIPKLLSHLPTIIREFPSKIM